MLYISLIKAPLATPIIVMLVSFRINPQLPNTTLDVLGGFVTNNKIVVVTSKIVFVTSKQKSSTLTTQKH